MLHVISKKEQDKLVLSHGWESLGLNDSIQHSFVRSKLIFWFWFITSKEHQTLDTYIPKVVVFNTHVSIKRGIMV